MKGGSRFANVVFAARKCLTVGSSGQVSTTRSKSVRGSAVLAVSQSVQVNGGRRHAASLHHCIARVDVVHACAVLLDENLSISRHGDRMLLQLEDLRPAVPRDHHGLHRWSKSRVRRSDDPQITFSIN